MKKILLLLCVLFSTISLADDRSKIVYVQTSKAPEAPFYIGDTINISYKIILFGDAKVIDISADEPRGAIFLSNTKKDIDTSVFIDNGEVKQNASPNNEFEITYYYKITSTSFRLPSISVEVKDAEYKDIGKGPSFSANATDLSSNPDYANVVAESFEVTKSQSLKYDDSNNMLVMEIVATRSNIKDLKIKNVLDQGIKSANYENGVWNMIYYVVLPNSLSELSFNYFNLKTQKYTDIHINIDTPNEAIQDNSDLKPKNSLLIFKNILLFVIFASLLLVSILLRKKYRRLSIASIFASILFLIWLIYAIFNSSFGILLNGAKISILPTKNSTILQNISSPVDVEIVGEYKNYLKVITQDGKAGWTNKEYVKR